MMAIAAIGAAASCDAGLQTPRDGGSGDGGATSGDGPGRGCGIAEAPLPDRPLTLGRNEVALRLADFLWRKPADSALLQKTAALRTTRDVATLVAEMQADPRAADGIDAFTAAWLALEKLDEARPRDFVGWTPELAADIKEESLRFVRGMVGDAKGTLTTLLTSSATMVNAPLAAVYGISPPPPAGEWRQVTLDPMHRAGVTTLLGRLTAAPRATPRGIWVRQLLMCDSPVPPPPPLTEGHGMPLQVIQGSNRQRLEMLLSRPECAACHQLFDGLGFAFEHFDEIGQFRTDDHGLPIDTKSSTFRSSGTLTFDGAVSLMGQLAADCEVQRCMVRIWLGHASGSSTVPATDDDNVTEVLGAFRAAGLSLQALQSAITQSPLFLAP